MGGSSGGKSDKQTSTMKLPPQIEALANRNLEAAEKAGQIGYVPFQGPTVRALNPLEINSMKQNEAAMKAFGMAPASVDAAIPAPTEYAGGVQGYDPMALYLQALGKIDPAQMAAIKSFTNPQAVASGASRSGTPGSKGGMPNPMIGGGLNVNSLGWKPPQKRY